MTHIKEEFVDIALLVFFLKVNVAQRVNHKNLAILSNNPLALSRRTLGGIARLGLALRLAALLARRTSFLTLLLRLLHTSLPPVYRLRRALLVLGRRRRRRERHLGSWDAGATPSRLAGELDVALDKLDLALPAHVEDDVVHTTTTQQENANHDSPKTRSIPIVIVISPLPQREPIPQKVVIAVPLWAPQNIRNQRQSRLRVACLLDSLVELTFGGLLRIDALLGLEVGLELLLDLVGVQGAGLGAVGFGDVVNGSGGDNVEDVVEGG